MLSIEYLAGFVDGEGCISLVKTSRERTTLKLILSNTHLPILIAIQEQFGGYLYENCSISTTRHKLFRLIWAGNKQVKPLLEALLPHCVVKKAQIEYILNNWFPLQSTQGKPVSDELRETRQKMIGVLSQMKREELIPHGDH